MPSMVLETLSPTPLGQSAALLVVDMQMGFDDPAWGVRNNPMAEANVEALLASWRATGALVLGTAMLLSRILSSISRQTDCTRIVARASVKLVIA